jgi:phage recombination protein Bet
MTTAAIQTAENGKQSLITTMANRYGLEPGKFYTTLEKTILPSGKNASQEQVAAFLVVANHYELNPFIKEIYAFPNQAGGISPIVSVDGWLTIINRQPTLDGIEYEDHMDDSGNLTAITCRIYRKDRSRPNEITEYMKECKRKTSTWDQWPARMLRHKALIQCARQAFGLAGIYDPDEAERIASNENANGNDAPIAEKTRAKVEEMKKQYAPAPVEEPEPQAYANGETFERTSEIVITDGPETEAIEGEVVTDEPPSDDSDLDQGTEDLRAAVQELLAGFGKQRAKDLQAGKTPVSKMTGDELADFYQILKAESE